MKFGNLETTDDSILSELIMSKADTDNNYSDNIRADVRKQMEERRSRYDYSVISKFEDSGNSYTICCQKTSLFPELVVVINNDEVIFFDNGMKTGPLDFKLDLDKKQFSIYGYVWGQCLQWMDYTLDGSCTSFDNGTSDD